MLPSPPMPPLDLAEQARQTEEAIAAYQASMRAVPPTYHPGDQVEFCGQVYKVLRYCRNGEPGYLLRCGKEQLFLVLDYEKHLRPVQP